MSAMFEDLIEDLLEAEGGFVDDPADRGGRTKYGVTQTTFNDWRDRQGQSRDDVADLDLDEAKAIYRALYWDTSGAGRIRSRTVAAQLLDLAVNCGVGAAVMLLQDAVNICHPKRVQLVVDGAFGPRTVKAVSECDSDTLFDVFRFLAAHRYLTLVDRDPSQVRFRRGWILRLAKPKGGKK